ncbi:unnamed protein product [Lampetra fluviatilis]
MSKSEARRKNPPVVHSDDDDSMEEVPAMFPETGAPERRPVEPSRPEQEEMAAVGGYSPPPDTWRVLSSQLELLLQSVLQLAITVAEQLLNPYHQRIGLSLPAAYAQMAAVFEPPSSARLKFSLWRREEGEPPLAFRSSLLALAWAAYPDLEGAALDSLALQRLLSLARELGIALTITGSVPTHCFRCDQQGHIALGCRNAPGAFNKDSSSSP